MATRRSPRAQDADVQGERLLTAVERIVEDCDTLIGEVEAYKASVEPNQPMLRATSRHIVADYSTKSAVAGALTALPCVLPGAGTALVVGGSLVDMTLMLKHEVEMILCLTYLYGYDIRNEKERWLAYILAGVRTCNASSRRNYLADLAEVQIDALPKYTPRQLSKLAVTILGRVVLLSFSKSLVRAVPLVGVVVGASANKLLTTSVGWACVEALERRRWADRDTQEPPVDAVVE